MKIDVLGYYGGYPENGIATSSYLVTSGDYHLLVDLGSGGMLALEKRLPPFDLNAVLLTHYHHDHAADIGVLQYYYQLHPGEKRADPLPIYGHTMDPVNFAQLTFGDFTIGKPYTATSKLELGPLELTFLMTEHPVPAFAVRIVEKATGQTIVNTSDTRAFEGLTDFVKGADLLLADTNFLNDKPQPRWHLTAGEAGKLAADAQVKQLLLTHLPQTVDLAVLRAQAEAESAGIPVVSADQIAQIDLDRP